MWGLSIDLCLSRATLTTVRLDMKAAMQGTVWTNLNINILITFWSSVFFVFFRPKLLIYVLYRKYIYRQLISYSEKGKVLVSLTLMVKGRERARMRSENARLKIKIFRADLILSLMTAIRTKALLTTKNISLAWKKLRRLGEKTEEENHTKGLYQFNKIQEC